MDIQTLVAELTKERDRIDKAIAALSGLGSGARRGPGRPPGGGGTSSGAGRRRMSPAARKRISEMMKKRWAERKRKAKAA
jgi:hypothetical protein